MTSVIGNLKSMQISQSPFSGEMSTNFFPRSGSVGKLTSLQQQQQQYSTN
jgi:hypothetical protein